MAHTETTTPLFESQAELIVEATPTEVYALVSDLPRSREWSPECTGGEWISGTPGTPGAVFRGHNLRGEDVVSWAPVVRGTWTTEAEIHTAVPGTEFSWAMRDSQGRAQTSVWAFRMIREPNGCRLVHHFRMDAPTEGIRKITQDMGDDERRRFITEWGAKVGADLHETLRRIKAIVESER
ncbi:SRPBCC family protein [Micromonospora sp. NPDC005203]|uniref:SRPBCC family protein n=1 Tax=Micromonospora sp. NPDC005203 TaxID=3364226 RepID=UPI0036994B43